MDLLDFARGPGLWLAVGVFVLGTVWRVASLLRWPRRPDRSPPRDGSPPPWRSALRGIGRGMWPRPTFGAAAQAASLNGYVFHVGLAIVVFGYAPHIAFVRRSTGLAWPALPDAVMYVAAGVTIVALLLALWSRLNDPVRRRLSRADDFIAWAVTFAPLLTGMAVLGEPSAAILARDHALYRGPLAVHLLSLELLLVWFPFGKLMHAVLFPLSRAATGMRLGHRGVAP